MDTRDDDWDYCYSDCTATCELTPGHDGPHVMTGTDYELEPVSFGDRVLTYRIEWSREPAAANG